jgi:hypothetical protein
VSRAKAFTVDQVAEDLADNIDRPAFWPDVAFEVRRCRSLRSRGDLPVALDALADAEAEARRIVDDAPRAVVEAALKQERDRVAAWIVRSWVERVLWHVEELLVFAGVRTWDEVQRDHEASDGPEARVAIAGLDEAWQAYVASCAAWQFSDAGGAP